MAVTLTVILGLGGMTAMYFRAERLRVEAEQASQQAKQATEKEATARAEAERFWAHAEAAVKFLLKDVLGNEDLVEGPDSDPYYGLYIVTEKLDGGFVHKPLVEAIIREEVGERYNNVGKPELAIPHLERAYQICLQELGSGQLRTIGSSRPLGWAYVARGRDDDALRLWNENLEMIQEVHGEEHRLAVLFMNNIGNTYTRLGRYEEAKEILTKALEINERVFKWQYYRDIGRSHLAQNYRHLAQNYVAQGRYSKLAYDDANDTYTLLGSGRDIWRGDDQFHYAHNALNGDGSITARIESIEYPHEWTKVGVMMRDTTTPDSAFAAVFVTPWNRVCFQYRSATGEDVVGVNSEPYAVSLPCWVRLIREGNAFKARHSDDGTEWKDLEVTSTSAVKDTRRAVVEIGVRDPVHVGLAVCSHSGPGIPAKVKISNVTTTGDVDPPGEFLSFEGIGFKASALADQ
jgi:tetratricopeptide (TPR) repeat protein